MAYGWIINKDYLADQLGDDYDDTGVMGPRNISEKMEADLKAGKGYTFYMYDDDGERYYKGRAIWDAEDEGSEEACFGPLDDFGRPNAGCTLIKWHGHPEWDCG